MNTQATDTDTNKPAEAHNQQSEAPTTKPAEAPKQGFFSWFLGSSTNNSKAIECLKSIPDDKKGMTIAGYIKELEDAAAAQKGGKRRKSLKKGKKKCKKTRGRR